MNRFYFVCSLICFSLVSPVAFGAPLPWLNLLLLDDPPLVSAPANQTAITGIQGTAIASTVFTASGGRPPYRWQLTSGQLPAGLSLNSTNGTLSGTPTAVGTFGGTITVSDNGGQTAQFNFSLTIHSKFVVVKDGKFQLHGANWYPFGVNYYPHYAVNPQPDFSYPQPDHWLGSANYDSAAVEQDLAALEALGVNCISTRGSPTEDTWPALTDFLNRCLNHGIRVFLSLPEINPLKPELYGYEPETSLDDLITGLNLADNPAIFAYDIAYEPNLGAWGRNDGTSVLPWLDMRSRYDVAWSRFIFKEYGGTAAAETAFGRSMDRDRTGQAVGIVSHNLPSRAVAGQTYSCSLTLKNMGSIAWTNDDPDGKNHYLGAVLGSSSFAEGWALVPDDTVTPASDDIITGEQITFTMNYTAPATLGRQRLLLSMIQNNVAWFGSLLDWQVEVVASGASAVQETIILPEPVLGPTDDELLAATHDPLVSAFRRFLDTHTATRFGHATRHLRSLDPNHLISCRQGWGGNGSSNHIIYYPLELYATAHHFDFLGPENYEFMYDTVSDTILSGSATTEAYARWASNGKPVLWTEAAFLPMTDPDESHNQAQATYYDLFIDHMLTSGADGVLFWWWPGGTRSDEGSDFGITDGSRNLRPAALTMQTRAAEATADRQLSQTQEVGSVDLHTAPRGYEAIYNNHRATTLAAYKAGKRYVMQGDGAGSSSDQEPQRIAGLTKHLWADISFVELRVGNGEWFEVRDGYGYAISANTAIEARAAIVNMGDAAWLPAGSPSGVVSLAGNENHGLQFRQPVSVQVNRMEEVEVASFTISSGITADTVIQFQMVADTDTWISGALRIDLFPQ